MSDRPELPNESLQNHPGLQSEVVPGVLSPAQDGGHLRGECKRQGRTGEEVGSE